MISDIFSEFQKEIDVEQDCKEEIRVAVRELENTARQILTTLQRMHQFEGIKQIPSLCSEGRTMFAKVKDQYVALAGKVPAGQYYRFHDIWRFVTQRLAFLAALLVYLETDNMLQMEELATLLGINVSADDSQFHLDLEDYLTGLLTLASELSRLAVNSVTAKDYRRPIKISNFLNELNSGFRLLNLKNDALRKRFDGLKYDLKKVEEVVYDLSIRGLTSDDPGTTSAAQAEKTAS